MQVPVRSAPAVDDRPGETRCAYSLFQQPWWLDAVAPGGWSEVTATRDGRTVARLPFVETKRWGMRLLGQPRLTQTLGPWLAPGPERRPAAIAREHRLLSELIDALPPSDHFQQALSPRLLNGLPFYWTGCSLTVRYTYRLDDLSSEEALWAGLDPDIRRQVRNAGKQLEVRDDLGLDAFFAVYAKSFARQGLPVPVERELLDRIEQACEPRGARTILFVQDAAGRVHAVIYVVHDGDVAYALLSGGDPELRRSGAGALAQWESIRSVAGKTQVYDFEGSMIRGIEHVNRNFGAAQTPYVVVTRTRLRVRAALTVRNLAARVRRRR